VRSKHTRRSIAAAALLALLYCAAAETWLPRDETPTGPLAAIVVLGSYVLENGRLDANGRQRLIRAIGLARATRSQLITTRIRRVDPPILDSDADQKHLVDSLGLGAPWTILQGDALTTRDEAERLRRALPPGAIAVVTTRLHTRRACATFEKAGYAVTCVAAGVEVPLWKAPLFVLYESAALIKYRLKGWI
jgi:uncharacterized SAM-binding protein YcdF (DUF218 family)